MAAKTVTVPQIKVAEVPKKLQEGEEFIKWDESSGVGTPVILRIDENGFFLYWLDQTSKEILEILDLSMIRDARTGKYAKIPKDLKMRGKVESGMKVESGKGDALDAKQDKSVAGPTESKLSAKDDKQEDKASSLCLEDCTVTICYGTDFVNLTFINFYTTKRESAQIWTEEIVKLVFSLSLLNSSAMRFLMKVHAKLCLQVDKNNNIPIKNIVKMFAQNKEDKKRVEEALQLSIFGPGTAKDKLSSISISQFTFEEHFFLFYKNLMQRTEVQKIYESLCNRETNMIGVSEFTTFLNGTQRDPRLNEILHPYAKSHNVIALIELYEKNKENISKHQLSFDGFLRYLMSDDNPIIAASKLEVSNPESMEHPLAHYFINSSHNTYLTGHQITGKSSVEIYRQCLLSGCRCVELDFWNGPKDEPCIVHGYTFVPEVSAKEVIEAIAESAFKTSEYPVILSFENHCNRKQQSKIAQYCRDIFGDMLLDAPLESHSLKGDALPPPSLLKRKIIIKNKKKMKKSKNKYSEDSSSGSDESGTEAGPSEDAQIEDGEAIQTDGTSEKPSTDVPLLKRTAPEKDPDGQIIEPRDVERRDTCAEKEAIDDKRVAPKEMAPPIPGEHPSRCDTPDLEHVSGSTLEKQTPDRSMAKTAEDITCVKIPKPPNGEVAPSSHPTTVRQSSKESVDEDDEGSSSDGDGDAAEDTKTDKEKGSTKETEAGAEISALVNYVQPVHFISFEVALQRRRFYEMSSFDEKQALTLLREYPKEFVNYNKRQLSRVYPAGIRFDSSNFMPQLFWNAGCQLVALNYQTLDLGMQFNLGLFEFNQRCGYLLKPEFMRREDRKLDIFSDSTVDGIVAGTLKVYVLSGQFLTDKRVGTYVEIHMYGLPADSLRKKFRTRIVPNNGINPVYGKDEEKDKPFECEIVVLPELASIRIAAYEESGKFIGHRVLPLVGLCPGYRHVTLRNEAGQPLLATLFLQIIVNDFVPDEFHMFAEALTNPREYQNKMDKYAKMLAGLTEGTEVCETKSEGDEAFGMTGPSRPNGAPQNGEGSRMLSDRSMSEAADELGLASGMIGPAVSKRSQDISTPAPGATAGLIGLAGVAASSAAAGAAAGASAAASLTAKRASIAPTPTSSTDRAVNPGVVRSTSGELSTLQDQSKQGSLAGNLLEEVREELNVETLEELMKCKAVREKRLEMDKKLENLRKKHEKERNRIQIQRGSQDSEKKSKFSMSNKLVKRLSTKNMHGLFDSSSGAPDLATQHEGDDGDGEDRLVSVVREQLSQERDLQKKHQETLFLLLTKTMEASQTTQLKLLKSLQERETADMMRKLEATRRKEMKELSKKHKDREEMDRIKRELASAAVEKGVNERVRLEEMYEHKKKELEEQHQLVRTALQEEKKKMEDALKKEYDCRLARVKEEIQPTSSSDSQDPH